MMVIGVPKEIKDNENRVAMTPAGVLEAVRRGHRVVVEHGAGIGSGINDAEYENVGATILKTADDVFGAADMIVKVKEPLEIEYSRMKEKQILFTYLHLAANKALTEVLIEKRTVSIAYETVRTDSGALPLLSPMSKVAGRMSVQVGAHYLEKSNGGQGILLGGVPGVPPANVVIVGGGTVGTNAARMAVGLGARVSIIERNPARLNYLDELFRGRVTTLTSNTFNIASAVKDADLLIGCVLIPGAKAPKLVTEAMVKTMKPGSVIVDVAIDQGGSIETVDHPTTHGNPVYVKHGVVHYAVANMPGIVARTSSYALTDATLPYVLDLADKGYAIAIAEDQALAQGVNVINGNVTCRAVAEAHGLPYCELRDAM